MQAVTHMQETQRLASRVRYPCDCYHNPSIYVGDRRLKLHLATLDAVTTLGVPVVDPLAVRTAVDYINSVRLPTGDGTCLDCSLQMQLLEDDAPSLSTSCSALLVMGALNRFGSAIRSCTRGLTESPHFWTCMRVEIKDDGARCPQDHSLACQDDVLKTLDLMVLHVPRCVHSVVSNSLLCPWCCRDPALRNIVSEETAMCSQVAGRAAHPAKVPTRHRRECAV